MTEKDIQNIQNHETCIFGVSSAPEHAENDKALRLVCEIIDCLIEGLDPEFEGPMKFNGSLREDYEREIRFMLSYTEFKLSIGNDYFVIS